MFDKTRANDKDYMLSQQWWALEKALENASPELQNDKDVTLEAVSQNGQALEYASPELQNDKDVALKAIGNDEDVILEAVKNNGRALEYESYEGFDDIGDDDPGDIGD